MDPAKIDLDPAVHATLPPAFEWNSGKDLSVLDGAWSVGELLPPLTIVVSANAGKIQSREKLYGGECFTGSLAKDWSRGEGWGSTVLGKFGPFFEVTGVVVDGGIEWNNGARWRKLG